MRDQSADLFLKISLFRMTDHYLPKLVRSLEAIDAKALWGKNGNENSIGGIALHICEHVNRHIERHFLSGKADNRTGIENYFPDTGMPPSELSEFVRTTFLAWKRGMEDLLRTKDQEIDMHSFYHLVEHTGYHLGQIVDRVQRTTGTSFRFCQNGINEANLRKRIELYSMQES